MFKVILAIDFKGLDVLKQSDILFQQGLVNTVEESLVIQGKTFKKNVTETLWPSLDWEMLCASLCSFKYNLSKLSKLNQKLSLNPLSKKGKF